MNKKIWIYLIVGFLIYIIFLFITKKENEIIQAEYPLTQIEYVAEKEVVILHLSPISRLSEVINLDVFEGIDPYMTTEEQESIIGMPDDSKMKWDINHDVYYTKIGRLEIGSKWDLGDNSSNFTTILRFYRENIPLNIVLNDGVLKQISTERNIKQLYIKNEDEIDFYMNFSNEEEDFVQWVYNDYAGE